MYFRGKTSTMHSSVLHWILNVKTERNHTDFLLATPRFRGEKGDFGEAMSPGSYPGRHCQNQDRPRPQLPFQFSLSVKEVQVLTFEGWGERRRFNFIHHNYVEITTALHHKLFLSSYFKFCCHTQGSELM